MSTFRGSRIPANPRKPTQFPRPHTSYERILIFMIQEKDASTPCDERSVKNISNVNFSTQKKTGGKCIMGNQGMTNWKFSAFFAIVLMLVAGLFSTTAMAADGDGRIRSTTPLNAVTTRHEAGSILDTLVFSYTIADPATSQMGGGMFEMQIPEGWAFAAVDTPNANDPAGGTTIDNGAGTDGGILSIPGASRIRVRLGDDWSTGSIERALGITLSRVVVPVPDRLTDGNRDDRYEEDEFTSYSRTRSGRLRELDNIVLREGETDPTTGVKVPDIDPAVGGDEDVDDEIVRTISGQPFVRVGNIGSGKGTVVITPDKVYETYSAEEGPRRIVLKFTAAGPMWNSLVDVVIPQELDGISNDQLAAFQTERQFNPDGPFRSPPSCEHRKE